VLDQGETRLLLIDLSAGRRRLGGSILAQVTQQIGNDAPDVDEPVSLGERAARRARTGQTPASCWRCMTAPTAACSRRCAKWRFAAHCGVTVNIDLLALDPIAADGGDFKIRPDQLAVRRHDLTLRALFQRRTWPGIAGTSQ